jgi:predicted phosphoadenosine phosphosulfate sulfurtransferase
MKKKQELEKPLLENTRERMDHVMEEYDHVFVAHSAGKDSTSAFNVTMDAFERNRDKMDNPIKIIHNCTEFKYPEEWEYFDRVWKRWEPDELMTYWATMPVLKSLLVNDKETWRFPYDERDTDKWVHDEWQDFEEEYDNVELVTPNHPYMEDFKIGMKHSDVAEEIMKKHQDEDDKVANITGLRAQESLTRYGAITTIGGYISEGEIYDGVHPVYDWKARDIWAIHEEQGWDYNAAYDKMHQAGYPPTEARNGPMWGPYPIGAQDAYKIRNWYPELYERAERRFEGCQFSFEFGSDLFDPEKPEDATWREYLAMIVNSLDDESLVDDIESTVDDRLNMHWDRANVAFQDTEPCPICGHSWKTLAQYAYSRKSKKYKSVH